MRKALRLRQKSLSTERTYLMWVRRFQGFIGEKSPAGLTGRDVQDFLSYLAVEKKIAPSTQNQALNAIVFFFRHVLEKNIDNELSAVRARQRRRLPVVLTVREVHAIFEQLAGTSRLMAMLIYGCGLRLQECLRLRIKDIDLEQNVVIVRSGKGGQGPQDCAAGGAQGRSYQTYGGGKVALRSGQRRRYKRCLAPRRPGEEVPSSGQGMGMVLALPF